MKRLLLPVPLKIFGAQVGVVLLWPVVALFASLGYIWRWFVYQFGLNQGHAFVQHVEGLDLMFICDKFQSKPHSAYCCVFALKGPLDLEKVWRDMEALYNLRDEKGRRIFWKLGSHPVKYFGYWFWEKVPDFQIKNQLHLIKGRDLSNESRLISVISEIQRGSFARESPPWDLTIAESEEGKGYAIYRMSHSLVDGYSFIKMCFRICGLEALPPDVAVDKRKPRSRIEKVKFLVLAATKGLGEYLKIWYSVPEKNIFTQPREASGGLGVWFYSLGPNISLEQLKFARKAFGTSFYSIVLAAIVGALRSVGRQEFSASLIPKHVKTKIPMSKPNHPNNKLCNHWRPMMIDLPLGTKDDDDPSNTIRIIDENLQSYNASIASEFAELAFDLLSLFPFGSWIDEITKFEGLTLISSLSVWSNAKIQMFGAEIEQVFYLMPVHRENLASFVWSGMSSNGSLRMALTAEQNYFPNSEILRKFSSLIESEFQKILKFAQEKAVN